MAIVSNPLIGASKQKMGGAVFSTWKGKNVLKTKPASVANPKTPAQVAQRSAMKQAIAILRQAPDQIKKGFKRQAIGKSEANVFVGNILKNAFDFTTPGVATLIPGNILTSRGTMAPTQNTSITADRSDNLLTVNFAATADFASQNVADKALVSAYNTTKGEWTFGSGYEARSTGSATAPMPAGWEVGDSLQVFLAFYNQSSGGSSDSTNSTTLIVA